MSINTMQDFTFKHSDQLDALYTQYTAAQIKALFDSRGTELRTALNLLITTLKSTEGASDIGTATIQDVDGTNIQDMLKSIRDKLKSVVDGTSGADFVNATAITGLTGNTIQSLLEALKTLADNNNTTQTSNLDNHKSSGDHDSRYYTQTQLQSVTSGSSGADLIKATPISANSGDTVQAQLAWLLSQIAIAATGSIPDGSITEVKLAQALIDKINTALSNTGVLTTLLTTNKSSLVNALNEVVANLNITSTSLSDLKTFAITSDFTGKVAGSTTENPNIFRGRTSDTTLANPSSFTVEPPQAPYTDISKLDGNIGGASTITLGSGIIPQQLFGFNLISIVERKYGTIPGSTTDKVTWLKNNIASIICNWYGYGSCQSGNKAYLSVWKASTNTWQTPKSNTNNSPSLISYPSVFATNTIGDLIDANGFINYLTYTDASNGTTTSTINTDYISLRIEFKDGISCLLTQYIDYVRHPGYAVTSGTSTAYTITLNPAPVAYVDGQQFTILPHTDCGTNPTLNINGLGASSIIKSDGISTPSAGEIKSNIPLSVVRVGSNFFIRNSSGNNIKSLQSGQFVMAVNTSTQTINITSVNINNSIVRVRTVGTSGASGNDEASIKLLNSTQIQIDRGLTAYNVTVYWEVIEFNNIKSKQSGSTACEISQQSISVTINNINISKSLLFVSFHTGNSTQNHNTMSAILQSPTNILLQKNNTFGMNVEWQVMEFN